MTSHAFTASLAAALLMLLPAVEACSGTGGVPVEGAFSISNEQPPVDVSSPVWLYLNATCLEPADRLVLNVHLPTGVTAHSGAVLEKTARDVAAGATVTLSVPVLVTSAEELTIAATATIADEESLVLRKPFALVINEKPKARVQPRAGVDADGDPIAIYPSGR